MRLLLAVLACLLLLLPATAQAETPVAFQTTYKAFNTWWPLDEKWQPESCNRDTAVRGYQPAEGGDRPIVMLVHGTTSEWGDLKTYDALSRRLAEKGFVAAYPVLNDSWLSLSVKGIQNQTKCVFRTDKVSSAVEAVAAATGGRPSQGVFAMGHSQGGAIALLSGNYNSNVRAAVGLGVSGPNVPEARSIEDGGTRVLRNDQIRVTDGQVELQEPGDQFSGRDALNAVTGSSCGVGVRDCLRADGSGYYIVANSEVTDGVADHCWFEMGGCKLTPTLDPRFLDGTGPQTVNAIAAWLGSKSGAVMASRALFPKAV